MASVNDKFVQVQGPFAASNDIITYIKKNYNSNMIYITHCGIQAEIGHKVYLNGISFEIGKTGMLEFNNVKITSLYFAQNEPASTLIDCVLD